MNLSDFAAAAMEDRQAAGFILDFDGSLSLIEANHREVSAYPGVREVLEKLARTYKVVAVVSGRRASDIERLVGAGGVHYFGLYGAERQEHGRTVQLPQSDRWRGSASRLARDAEALILFEGLDGCEVEYKDLAVSIHFRGSKSPLASSIIHSWAGINAPRRSFEARLGRKVVELCPAGVSKAGCLRELVTKESLRRSVVAGDDSADAEAFGVAKELLGQNSLCIGITSEEEPAELRLRSDEMVDGPEALLEILQLFLRDGQSRDS